MQDDTGEPDDAELERFWETVRPADSPAARPEAWAFGATVSLADELLALVLEGTKTATASALWDYEAENESLPEVGQLNILLDGRGTPRALVRTTSVITVPFNEVDAEHARLEGEGDRSLADWREGHRRFFTEFASHNRGFIPDMPVVLERFQLLHPHNGDEEAESARMAERVRQRDRMRAEAESLRADPEDVSASRELAAEMEAMRSPTTPPMSSRQR